uniref:ATP synthase complex subunit 8 n=1 Tax=Tullbergia bisetosa TaxID=345630 RepID=A0A5P9W7M6_9HEXA|nr:ATP synthase F0 subunit 8 [Tullbergia bisetosa]
MPQMAPMMWVILFTFTLLVFCLIFSKLYFLNYSKLNLIESEDMTNQSLSSLASTNWKW